VLSKEYKMIYKCKICKKKPNELGEYVECAKDWELTPDEYVRQQEGTFNKETGQFYCTECYYDVGMPLGTA
jgi:hypothetical protein